MTINKGIMFQLNSTGQFDRWKSILFEVYLVIIEGALGKVHASQHLVDFDLKKKRQVS
jgi:hypothetical protein